MLWPWDRYKSENLLLKIKHLVNNFCFLPSGYTFCQLHRLPEQHNCAFDHKESGRQEARKKMISPGPKKVGRSFQRIDEWGAF